MICRCLSILAIVAAIVTPARDLQSQVIRGRTEHTVCPTPFRPISGLTFHGGYVWAVTYHTFPYQMGFAQYSAFPDPATSDDGRATWYSPGASVECTNTWYLNPNGSVAYVDFRWHIISYRGNIQENTGSGCGGGGTETDPIYMTSYDPYAPDQEAVTVQDCGGGGGGGSGGGGGLTCWWEWMEIEISYNGGKTWETYWSGWGRVCNNEM